MDVVKTTVKSLGGKVKINSEEGHGAELTLTIPVTMGISVALIIESGNKNYAIPLDYVVETIKIKPDKLRRIHDRKGCYYRGEIIPVEKLDILLDNKKRTSFEKYSGDKEISIAILKNGCGKFGVIVDRLKKNIELAVKPVPESLSSIDVISGVSILGDGSVVLVLNPEKLI
jgi:two-component system chemotaxis sensor kinase CheA